MHQPQLLINTQHYGLHILEQGAFQMQNNNEEDMGNKGVAQLEDHSNMEIAIIMGYQVLSSEVESKVSVFIAVNSTALTFKDFELMYCFMIKMEVK